MEPGNRVILLSLNNWREYRLVKAHEVVRVSPKGGLMQQSGLKVNPATASMLLGDFVELQTGDWIVQNAANSSVGRAAIQLARLSGIKTVNVVRRSDVIDELKALGGDLVLLDGEDLAERVEAATKNAPIRLGNRQHWGTSDEPDRFMYRARSDARDLRRNERRARRDSSRHDRVQGLAGPWIVVVQTSSKRAARRD